MPGWDVDMPDCKIYCECSREVKDYIDFLEKITDVSMSIIAAGPDREQTVMRRW